jgi:mRNA interferase MazF
MKQPGQVVLFQFPQTDLATGKLRPAVLLAKLPGSFDDWLLCLVSSQARQLVQGFDELLFESDQDFASSGLHSNSIIRTGRLAVVEGSILMGAIGTISNERLSRIKSNLSKWLSA